MAHLDATAGSAPASSFSVEGELQMGWFASGDDNYHSRINGERIETIVARMLGFPSEMELDRALQGEVSSDSTQPDVVRTVKHIHLSVFATDENDQIL